MTAVSPLAPDRFPDIPPLAGVKLAAGACGVKYRDRLDVMFAGLAPETEVAGVFTRSKTAAAPVEWCRRGLANGRARGLVVNSGNANAFTGRAGDQAVGEMARVAGNVLDCAAGDVFVAQTGVIGEPIDVNKITPILPQLQEQFGADWEAAARAIMTTDTFPKGAVRQVKIGETPVTLAGIAKGSGMIAPDMATMLAFVFTDAAVPHPVLQHLLTRSADKSFNCITVDSDTSTSDTLLAFATGQAQHPWVAAAGDAHFREFRGAFQDLLIDLAHQVVRDGEGASKFVTINVSGATSSSAARKIGLAIANSPLVKTAIAGEDANWGRVVMAVGKSGEKVDRDALAIAIGGVQVAQAGGVVAGYDEAPVARHMKGQDIDIEVDVGLGRGRATVWTCDFTHDYISINADYRT